MRKPISTYKLGKLIGLGHWRIRYALEHGFIPLERKQGRCRWWSEEEIKTVCHYFGVPVPNLDERPQNRGKTHK